MDITLLIPTLNRPEFLIRELRYFQSMNFGGRIFIGDSSAAPSARLITDSLVQFANSLDIQYRHLPDCDPARVLQILAEEVTTPYVAFTADDDFLVPSGIAKCMEFLDAHPDYSAAHGAGVIISGNLGLVDYAGYYQQPIVEEPTAAQRLTDHLTNYSVSLFSVHRVEVWRAMFKDATRLADRSFGSELLPCCLSVVEGKIKQLDGLYLIRQAHDKRYLLPGWFEWMTGEDWRSGYLTFREYLAEAIVRQDGISIDEARQTVVQAFLVYLTCSISGTTSNPSPNISLPRQIAQRIPGARKAWRSLQVLRDRLTSSGKLVDVMSHSGIPDTISLSTLLDMSSPYHTDFMPVYNAVTNLPTGTV